MRCWSVQRNGNPCFLLLELRSLMKITSNSLLPPGSTCPTNLRNLSNLPLNLPPKLKRKPMLPLLDCFRYRVFFADPNFNPLQVSPQQLARQLTVIEQGNLQSVDLTDFYNKAWTSPAQTPGLTAWIEQFTEMTYWIASTIIAAQDEHNNYCSKARKDTISFWITVMNVHPSFYFKNYSFGLN